MTDGESIRRRPDVLWRRSLDAVVLLPAGAADSYVMAATGPAIWDLLAEWRTEEGLIEALAARFGAQPEVVAADVAPVLDDLRELGAIEVTAFSGGAEPG